MANKYKKIYKTNLQIIREELGYSQKQMGEKLNVTPKTIRNYEYFETNFPLESAIFLSQKYGYTLDWIYRNSEQKKSNAENTLNAKHSKDISKFLIDIRDFISRSNGNIHFTIPNYYWDFMKRYNEITSSNLTNFEKKRELSKIEAAYTSKKPEGFCYRFSIQESEFVTRLHFDDDFIPYVDSNVLTHSNCEPTEEQKQEIMSFLESILNE